MILQINSQCIFLIVGDEQDSSFKPMYNDEASTLEIGIAQETDCSISTKKSLDSFLMISILDLI
jgi:hypothetical protein